MTTPTESTSGIQHHSSFTHHVDEGSLAHARENNGEYEIDPPDQQEASRGKEYVPPKEVKFYASGGMVASSQTDDGEEETNEFPEQSFRIQAHNAHSHSHEHDLEFDDDTQKQTHKRPKRDSVNNLVDRAMQLVANLSTSKSGNR